MSNMTRAKKRKERKAELIRVMGGECEECGVDDNPVIYDFHHINPEEKDVSWRIMRDWPWARLLEEIKKCILLCANCHRKRHAKDDD